VHLSYTIVNKQELQNDQGMAETLRPMSWHLDHIILLFDSLTYIGYYCAYNCFFKFTYLKQFYDSICFIILDADLGMGYKPRFANTMNTIQMEEKEKT